MKIFRPVLRPIFRNQQISHVLLRIKKLLPILQPQTETGRGEGIGSCGGLTDNGHAGKFVVHRITGGCVGAMG